MSIFARRQATERRAFQGYDLADAVKDMRNARLGGGWSNVTVTPDTVLTVPAVFASVQLTAGVISQLPFEEYVDAPGRTIRDKAPSSALLASPSVDVTPEDWRFQAVESAQLHGNAIGVIVGRDRRFHPTQVELVHPRRVQVRIDPTTREVIWRVDNSPIDRFDIWHMAGRPHLGTPLGMGLAEYMAEVAQVGIAARRYGSDWFNSGGGPVAVVRPHRDPGDEGAVRLKAKISEAIRTRAPLILPKDIEQEAWQGSKPSDAELVQLLRQNATDCAMFFAVPPELVGGRTGDSMTYSNAEHRMIDLLAFGVGYWLKKLERALERSLPRGREVHADEAEIIRTDIKTRTDVAVSQVRGGLKTQNEARGDLDLPPDPMGDRLLWPPNSVQVQTVDDSALTSNTPRE